MNNLISENLFLDYIPGVIWVIDRNLEYQEIRGEKMQEWGLARNEFIGKSMYEFPKHSNEDISIQNHLLTFEKGKTSYQVDFLGSTYQCNLNHLDEADIIVGVATDITNKLKLENKIEVQSNKILEYSIPIVPVLENTIVLPVVGSIDFEKADYIFSNVIGKIHEIAQLQFVIIDLSGVSKLGIENADILKKIHASLDLLGYTTIITGLQPKVAQQMVTTGVTMPRLQIFHSVKEALKKILVLH